MTGNGFPADEGPYEMVASFRHVPGGAACVFTLAEAVVLRSLVSQVADLVSGNDPRAGSQGQGAGQGGAGSTEDLEAQLGLSSHAEPPDDPILARLFPDGYRDDPEASAEFRRYTEESLRSVKVAAAQAVLATLPPGGGEIRLSEPECQQWLRALNDVRLALSVQLGVTEDNEDLSEGLTIDDPRFAAVSDYEWLGYLQESLVDALT